MCHNIIMKSKGMVVIKLRVTDARCSGRRWKRRRGRGEEEEERKGKRRKKEEEKMEEEEEEENKIK